MTRPDDDQIFEQNLTTLLGQRGDAAEPDADARARMRARLIARHGRDRAVRSPVAIAGWGLIAAAAGALVIANVGGHDARAPHHAAPTAPTVAAVKPIVLPDGSKAELGDRGKVTELGPRRVRIEGAVLLDVAPGQGTFTVETAQGELAVLGTRFLVEAAADRTTTSVLRGAVALRSGGGEEVLHAGEQGVMQKGERPTRAPAPRLSHLVSWVAERRAKDERPGPQPARTGALVARNPQWPEQEYPLPIRALTVDIHLENQVARVALDQTFTNPENQTLEGVYKFALPPGAAVSRLAMYVDGRLTESAVVERMAARRIYEDVVYQRRDPALLEQMGANKVSMRIFPLPPHQDKRVVLAYTQALARTYDDLTVTVPMPELETPVGEVAMAVKIVGCGGCEITSPSHAIEVARVGADAVVSHRGATETVGDSLVLRIRQSTPAVAVATTIAGGQRYLLVRARPTVAAAAVADRPKKWVILDDTSASRGPTELRAQAALIDRLVDDIDEHDQVMVIAFDATHRRFSTWQDAMAIDRRALAAFLAKDAGLGETDLGEALAGAVKLLDGAPGYVVYVGDGTATGERRTIDELRDALAGGAATFIGLGIGDGADLPVLSALADATGGVATTIDLGDDLAWRSLDLVASLYTTRITGLSASIDGAGPDAQPYLRSAQVAAGEDVELIVKAPARDDFRAVTLRGQAGGQPWSQTITIADAARAPGDGGYLPRMWAQRRLEALMTAGDRALAPCTSNPCPTDEERAIAAYRARKAEMVALGTEHFLLSQHTSLIVLENDAMYARYGVRKGDGATWAPYQLPATIAYAPTAVAPPPPTSAAPVWRYPTPWRYQDGADYWSGPMTSVRGGGFDGGTGWGTLGTIGHGSGSGVGFGYGTGRGVGAGGGGIAATRTRATAAPTPEDSTAALDLGQGRVGEKDAEAKPSADESEWQYRMAPDEPKAASADPAMPLGGEATAEPAKKADRDQDYDKVGAGLFDGDTGGAAMGSSAAPPPPPAAYADDNKLADRPMTASVSQPASGVGGAVNGALANEAPPVTVPAQGKGKAAFDPAAKEERADSLGDDMFEHAIGRGPGLRGRGSVGGLLEQRSIATKGVGRAGIGSIQPIAYLSSSDWRLDDVTQWLPGLMRNAYDDLADQLDTGAGAGRGSISPDAERALTAARAKLTGGRWRFGGDAELAVDGRGRFEQRTTLDSGVEQIMTYDGAVLRYRYPQLGLASERTVGDHEPALYAAALPILPPRPAQLARWYQITLSGTRTLKLAPVGGGPALELELSEDGVIAVLRSGGQTLLATARDGAGFRVTIGDDTVAVGYTADPGLDLGGGATEPVTVELPTAGLAKARAEVAAAGAGAPAWRHLQHQRAAAALTGGEPAELAVIARELAAGGQLSTAELALVSGGARWLSQADLDAALGMNTGAVVDYLRAAAGGRTRAGRADFRALAGADDPLFGTLAAYRLTLLAIEKGDGKAALTAFRRFADRGRNDVLRIVGAMRLANQFAWRDPSVLTALDEVATGPWRNLARQEAARLASYSGRSGQAADRWVALLTDVDLTALPPVIDWSARSQVENGARGSVGWQMAMGAWRQRVLTEGDYAHVMAFARAAALRPDGDLELALERAAALAGDDVGAIIEVAQLASATGRGSRAQALLDGARARRPRDPQLLRLASATAAQQGAAADAAALLTQALAAEADRPVALTQLQADYAQLIGLYRQAVMSDTGAGRERAVAAALAAGRDWRAMDPDNANRERQLGELLIAVGRDDEAWRYLSSPIDRAPREGTSFQPAAEVLESSGQRERALALWRRAFAIDATNPTWLERQAMVELSLGRRDEARATMRRITERRWHVRWDGVKWWAQDALRSM